MAVSDLYVAQYLLEATQAVESPLAWLADEAGSYSTHLNGVKLSLFHARTLGWTGLCLSLSRGEEVTRIDEPRPVALFGRKFRTDDEKRLSEAMQELDRAVAGQCQARRKRAWTLRESIRESLYRQILFPDAERR